MALKKFTAATGKASSANWEEIGGEGKVGQKLLTGDIAWIPATVTNLKWNVTTTILAFINEGVVNQEAGEIKTGGATVKSEADASSAANVIFKNTGTLASIPWRFFSTAGAEARQKIILGGTITAPGSINFPTAQNCKYILEGTNPFKATGNVVVGSTVDLEAVAVAIEGLEATFENKTTITSTGLIKMTPNTEFGGLVLSGAEETANLSGATVDISPLTIGLLSPNGKTFGTTILRACVKVTAALTTTALQVFNKGAVAEKGIQLAKGVTHTITGNIEVDGTKASPSRLESSVAGEPATVKISGNRKITKTAIVHDWNVEGGILYIECEGSAEGQKEAEEKSSGNTNVVFGPEPTAAHGLAMMV